MNGVLLSTDNSRLRRAIVLALCNSVWPVVCSSVCAGSTLRTILPVPLAQVTLTVQPARGGGRRDFTLTRQPIQYQPITSELCRGGGGGADGSAPLGYIRVATFSKQTPDAVRDAIRSLQVRAQAVLKVQTLHPKP